MKQLFSRSLLTLGLLMGLASFASAQTTVTQTTLTNAVGAGDSSVVLASLTGIGAGSAIYADSEVFFVTAVNATTLVANVLRGQDATGPAAHAAGEVVFASTLGTHEGPFVRVNPQPGTCVASAELYSLRINTRSGDIWRCVNATWMAVNDSGDHTFKNFPGPGPVVASATTIAPTSGLFHVTGTTSVATITVPVGCATGCQLTIVPDGIFATTLAGNIALISTTVVSKALIMTWEPVAAKWFPSY